MPWLVEAVAGYFHKGQEQQIDPPLEVTITTQMEVAEDPVNLISYSRISKKDLKSPSNYIPWCKELTTIVTPRSLNFCAGTYDVVLETVREDREEDIA